MKTMKTLFAICSTALIILFTGCSIDDSINNSPNDIREDQLKSKEGIYGLFVGMQSMTGDFYSADHSRIASMWSLQVTSGPGASRAQAPTWATYTLDPLGPPNDMWLYAYKAVHECDDLLRLTPQVTLANDPDANTALQNFIVAVAKVHKALIYGEMAAMFGSIPVHLVSITDPAYAPPQFVTQAEAYQEVQKLLDEALGGMSTVSFSRDLNFGGDGDKWKAVIHTLKARYYLHVSDYANALTHSQQGITDPSGSLFGFYSDNALEYSPWGHWAIDEAVSIVAAKPFVDALKADSGDTRLAEYFNPNDSGHYVGFSPTSSDPEESDFSRASTLKKYAAYSDDFPEVTYEENVLIKAEAEARTGDVGAAVTDVNIIRTGAGVAAFASTDAAATIAEVLRQKWLELFLEGQAYHDMRRTQTLPDPQPGKNFRINYPASERNANPNTPADADNLAKPLLGY